MKEASLRFLTLPKLEEIEKQYRLENNGFKPLKADAELIAEAAQKYAGWWKLLITSFLINRSFLLIDYC